MKRLEAIGYILLGVAIGFTFYVTTTSISTAIECTTQEIN